jgi:hypothetical protein
MYEAAHGPIPDGLVIEHDGGAHPCPRGMGEEKRSVVASGWRPSAATVTTPLAGQTAKGSG